MMSITVEIPRADVEELIANYVKCQLSLEICNTGYEAHVTISNYSETKVVLSPIKNTDNQTLTGLDTSLTEQSNG